MLDKFSAEKKKQAFYLVASVSAIAGIVLLASSALQNDKGIEKIDQPQLNIIDKKDTNNKTFRKEFGDKDAQQSAEIDALKEKLAALQTNGGAMPQQQAGFPNQTLPNMQQNTIPNILVPPAPPPAPISAEPSKMPEHEEKPKPITTIMGDMIGNISAPAPAVESGDKTHNTAPKKKKIELPSGSFMQGILLSGIDAPTGGKAKTGPHPVLIKITNMAKLPNKFRANLKECHVIGSGYGDLSSERAFVRVEKLTCMTEDGRAIEKGATGQSFGYVSGEDGKVGLPGRVVSKQGAILARTLAAGFLEGVAKGFNSSNMSYAVQPTGSVAIPDPTQTLQTGLMSGAGEASKKLADFYMKLANEMFPVVEINAGRKVDVVLLEKLSFEIGEGVNK